MSDALLLQWRRPRPLPSTRLRPTAARLRVVARRATRKVAGSAVCKAVVASVLLATTCLLLTLAWSALPSRHLAAAVPSSPPPAAPEWLDVLRPIHIFDLEAPVLHGLPLVYSARRRSAGDGREDMLAFGNPSVDAPALRLRLTRRRDETAARPPLFADLAQLAALSGLSVTRAGLADLLPTRFGAFEIADVGVTDGKDVAVPCSGFRLVLATPGLTIGGLACGAADMPLTRTALGCLLDRLDLESGGDDRAMIDLFAASERRRDPNCRGARLAPDALHAAWLDDKPVTHARTWRRH